MQKKLETTTPGPWQVHASPTRALGYMITRAALGPGGGIHIGNVYSEDNARLIAALPQLLEALRTIERTGRNLKDSGWGSYQDGYAQGLKEAADIAFAAIAAAEGDA